MANGKLIVFHTVTAGESLTSIARRILGNMNRWREIADINHLKSPYTITPGQRLQMPDDSPLEIPPIVGGNKEQVSGFPWGWLIAGLAVAFLLSR